MTIRELRISSVQSAMGKYSEFLKTSRNIPNMDPRVTQNVPKEKETCHRWFSVFFDWIIVIDWVNIDKEIHKNVKLISKIKETYLLKCPKNTIINIFEKRMRKHWIILGNQRNISQNCPQNVPKWPPAEHIEEKCFKMAPQQNTSK